MKASCENSVLKEAVAIAQLAFVINPADAPSAFEQAATLLDAAAQFAEQRRTKQ